MTKGTRASDAERERACEIIMQDQSEVAGRQRGIGDFLNRISYAKKIHNTIEGLADVVDFTRPFEYPSVLDERMFNISDQEWEQMVNSGTLYP